MTRCPLALLLVFLPLSASAQSIYKCIDAAGGITYASSKLDKSCKVVASGPENTLPAPPKPKTGNVASHPSPPGFPRVQEETQKARDGDRRLILEQELASEQRNLDQAKKDLAEQEAAGGGANDRTAPYRDRVGQHERNILAIQKELAALR